MAEFFTVEEFNDYIYGKIIRIAGPDRLFLTVDNDDVDHEQVKRDVERLVLTLNTHWKAT